MLDYLAVLVLQDPYFRRLGERPRLRYLELVLLAQQFAVLGVQGGVFTRSGKALTVADLADCLGTAAAELGADLEALAAAGLLACEAGAWRLANQPGRAEADVARRREWREQKRQYRAAQKRQAAAHGVPAGRAVVADEGAVEAAVASVGVSAGVSANPSADVSRCAKTVNKDNRIKRRNNYPPQPVEQVEEIPASASVSHFQAVNETAALTRAQRRTLNALEARYGPARVAECIDWAAESGIEARRAVRAIRSAVEHWQPKTPPARRAALPRTDPAAEALDPDLEYLRVNPHGAGRAGALARLEQKGRLPSAVEALPPQPEAA